MRALVAIVLSSLLGTCSFAPSVLEQIMSRGELRVVTRNSPAAFYYGADEPRGIEYELARGFAQRLGVDLRIYMADQFGQVFPDVVSGKADVAAAALTVADARKEAVTFGPAYQNIQQQVIYKRGTKRPRKVTDLLGGRLEVVAESAHAALLEQVRREEPMLTWIEDAHVGAEELLRKVAAGDIEYTIADSHVFALLRHFYPDVRVAFNLGPANQVAWVLPKKADELRESIAAYFAEIEATGELQRIFDRYYFASREFDYVGSRAFVRHYNTRLPQYREYFREAELATGVDWRLLAAMAYQESHWNPEAVSPTGVRGMMMLTEHTAAMMEVENRTDPRDEHHRRRALFQPRDAQGADANRRARPHLARGRGVQRGVRARRGRADLDANPRRKPGHLDRGPRAAPAPHRRAMVQARSARLRARLAGGYLRRQCAPLLRDTDVDGTAREPHNRRRRAHTVRPAAALRLPAALKSGSGTDFGHDPRPC